MCGPHARRSGCPSRCSWQLAGNSGRALCCPVQSSLLSCKLYIPSRPIERPPYRVSRMELGLWSGSMPPRRTSRDNTRSKARVREIFSNTPNCLFRGAPPPRVRTGVNQEVSFIEVEAGSDAATRPLKRLASQCHRPNSALRPGALHASRGTSVRADPTVIHCQIPHTAHRGGATVDDG